MMESTVFNWLVKKVVKVLIGHIIGGSAGFYRLVEKVVEVLVGHVVVGSDGFSRLYFE